MKKYINIVLIICLILLISGCNNKQNNISTYSITNENLGVLKFSYDKNNDFTFNELDNNKYSLKSEKLNMNATMYIEKTTDTYKDSNKYYKEKYKETYKEYKLNDYKGFTYSSLDNLELLIFIDETDEYTVYYYMTINHIIDSDDNLYDILESEELSYILNNMKYTK